MERGQLDVSWATPGADTFRAFATDRKAMDWMLPRWDGDRLEGLVRAPVWVVFFLIGALGGLGVWRNRAIEGCCARCGYELSGLAASDGMVRCPECGEENAVTPVLSREARTARRHGAWSIGVGVAMTCVILVMCAQGWSWSPRLRGFPRSSAAVERGAFVYHEMSVWSSDYVGDGVTSDLEWWRVMLPRVEWSGGLWYVRVPLWPISAAFIGWGCVRRFRACQGDAHRPLSSGGEARARD
ncbi:MAG: hypothetical protein U0638_07515 [Phycisphaerales bacterium]